MSFFETRLAFRRFHVKERPSFRENKWRKCATSIVEPVNPKGKKIDYRTKPKTNQDIVRLGVDRGPNNACGETFSTHPPRTARASDSGTKRKKMQLNPVCSVFLIRGIRRSYYLLYHHTHCGLSPCATTTSTARPPALALFLGQRKTLPISVPLRTQSRLGAKLLEI